MLAKQWEALSVGLGLGDNEQPDVLWMGRVCYFWVSDKFGHQVYKNALTITLVTLGFIFLSNMNAHYVCSAPRS